CGFGPSPSAGSSSAAVAGASLRSRATVGGGAAVGIRAPSPRPRALRRLVIARGSSDERERRGAPRCACTVGLPPLQELGRERQVGCGAAGTDVVEQD